MTTAGHQLVPQQSERPHFAPLRLVTFFLLAYGFSWAWVIPWAATHRTVFQGRGWPTHFPSLVGPLLAAVAVTAWTRGGLGVRDLLARMVRWRIGWRWWLICLTPLAAFAVVLGFMAAAGLSIPPRSDFIRFSGLPSSWGVIGVVLAVLVINGFGEETGWRGYALPQLQLRFAPLTATLILAAVWAAWHVPQFFLLDSYKDFSLAMLPVFFLGLTCGAVVLTWLYNRTSSILAVAIWHGLYNLTGATAAATSGNGTISAAMWTFAVLLALVLLYVEWQAHRRGRPTILQPR